MAVVTAVVGTVVGTVVGIVVVVSRVVGVVMVDGDDVVLVVSSVVMARQLVKKKQNTKMMHCLSAVFFIFIPFRLFVYKSFHNWDFNTYQSALNPFMDKLLPRKDFSLLASDDVCHFSIDVPDNVYVCKHYLWYSPPLYLSILAPIFFFNKTAKKPICHATIYGYLLIINSHISSISFPQFIHLRILILALAFVSFIRYSFVS